jgi:predicted transcriptional regulator
MSKVFYGAQATDDCNTSWNAIKVYQDGNPVHLSGPYDSQDLAETMAEFHEAKDDFERKMEAMTREVLRFRELVKQYQADIEELQGSKRELPDG